MQNPSEHKPNDFTPVVSALELADYVITITDNFNKFPDFTKKERKNEDGTVTAIYIQRQDSLVNKLREQSSEIFVLLYTANQINLNKDPERKEERLNNQTKAIELCRRHLAYIQLCRKHFHLSANRIKHWGEMVMTVLNSAKKWHESDKSRYKNI